VDGQGQQLAEPGFIDDGVALAELFDFGAVGIDARDPMPQISQTGACYGAYITCSYNCDSHLTFRLPQAFVGGLVLCEDPSRNVILAKSGHKREPLNVFGSETNMGMAGAIAGAEVRLSRAAAAGSYPDSRNPGKAASYQPPLPTGGESLMAFLLTMPV
jgi:hypothetical protein